MQRTALGAIAVAATLALVGVIFVLGGMALIDQSDAHVQQGEPLGCGLHNCTVAAPGTDHPEGTQGQAYMSAGYLILQLAIIPTIIAALLLADVWKTGSKNQ
jgi:hypothetical protein